VTNANQPRIRVGTFTVEGTTFDRKLPPGTYAVQVSADGRKSVTIQVKVTRGGTAKKVIALEPDLMRPTLP
jgi:hypothetical protein